ncbi:MAG: DUF58 domain-containing protein [Flavobacteriaceae bacterium]|jgi:uncharacterized protein (DUF58 family)|nr:DUF58 domain-containing protein [Flavobacteriaceae bacterium]
MALQNILGESVDVGRLELLAADIVEGFMSGFHRSPFHGFSSEFAEHRTYNPGESTRHIDWRLYAKTDRFYTKRFEDETNLRCHFVLDNSSSMHFPKIEKFDFNQMNKVGFSVLAIAALLRILKKQRDAVGLSVYSQNLEFYAPEKSATKHHHLLLDQLVKALESENKSRQTDTYHALHDVAEKCHRRSMIFVFTDMMEPNGKLENLFDALRHLKFNKHEVVLFHTYDQKQELDFSFGDKPRTFVDVETGASVRTYASQIQTKYKKAMQDYFDGIRLKCRQYHITYVPVDIAGNFNAVLTSFLLARQKLK